jgi:hypothetical protein
MQFVNRRSVQLASGGTAILGLALVLWVSGGTTEAVPPPNILRFDVAENGTRFVFDETPVHEDGLPAYGCEYITEGYLYPVGTLTCADNVCNGANPDGSPEFPDLVLGTWTCYGMFVGDGAHTLTGPWVISTQMFDFGAAAGQRSIMTSGIERADFDVPFQRAIAGATGTQVQKNHEQTQVFLGFNPSIGVSLRVSFAKPSGDGGGDDD